MKFAKRHDIVFAGGVIRIEAERSCIAHKADIAPAKLSIRPWQVIIETELLRDDVNKQRLFAWRKLIHALCPKWNSEAEEEHSLDQDDGEFQMRRDAAPHTAVIRTRLPALPEPNQHENKKRRPTNKKRGHEPVTKLQDVVDLISMG